MADEKREKVQPDNSNKNAGSKPDPETLNTTDPQEHMRGPFSSVMHKIEEKAKENDQKDKEDPEIRTIK
ncbi:hypothetical protein [Parafilimonas terrae]|jgi:hypothetical protein|uniref:Uncharacterized protein n=1 Tax=Parafilimonas terrae TaxID=1465490 RepID=A0A1I5ZB03_9BACT|nr:hypothetical protein [Parafilimonas terrae]SFQ53558.1 hypothetical protein SAMN05444277_11860 [Parafilimonas terrae]